MKKGERRLRIPPEGSLRRYDWSKSSRGRYAARFPREAHAVVIDPNLWPYFRTAEAVNDGLRALVELAALAAKLRAKKPAPKHKDRSAA